MRRKKRTAAECLALAVLALLSSVASAQSDGPNDWLWRMAKAVKTTNYEGTVIRLQDGTHEVFRVVHVVADGVIRERVSIQEGNGLEIIRNGNVVHCILPDQESVLVEEWNDQSTLFSALPSSDVPFNNEYDLSIVRKDRVAGRKAALLAIRPHDRYRFGYRIWLDVGTGFPLQRQLIADDGTTVEHVKFADISLGEEIHPSAVAPSYSTESFRWFTQPRRNVAPAPDSQWSNSRLPAGFRIVSTQREDLPGSGAPVTRILYSDGLAQVSVFIVVNQGKKIAQRSRVGASNSYSTEIGEFQVTAVGDVPAITVEQIATSMRPL